MHTKAVIFLINFIFMFFHISCIAQLKLGCENIAPEQLAWLQKQSVALIMNQSSVDQQGRKTLDKLLACGVNVALLLSPEHGVDGAIEMEADIYDSIEVKRNIPIISLYAHGGRRQHGLHKIDEIDVIIFDVQDVGMRHYTYIATMMHAMELAVHYNTSFMVFDRPNPLGKIMEGPVVDPQQHSFIASINIPVRHGMTIGELAQFINQYALKKKVQLRIVPMKNYVRGMHAPKTISLALSPNIQSQASCLGYSFLGLLGEVRPCDVAVGTPHAFQCILLPESQKISQKQWFVLDHKLRKLNIKSQWYSYFSTRKKQQCSGLKIKIPDINQVKSFDVFLCIVDFLKKAGVKISFSDAFDRVVGTHMVRSYLQGKISKEKLVAKINRDMQQFYQKSQTVFLY